jgi:SOS response regulatory protein OraA/RecX
MKDRYVSLNDSTTNAEKKLIELGAENKRLREALELIVAGDWLEEMKEIANTALAQTPAQPVKPISAK